MSPETPPKPPSYSSAGFYCQGNPDGITTEDPAFCEFGEEVAKRRNSYVEFLKKFEADEDELFKNFEHPLGSREFIRRLLKINGRYIPRRKGGIPKH